MPAAPHRRRRPEAAARRARRWPMRGATGSRRESPRELQQWTRRIPAYSAAGILWKPAARYQLCRCLATWAVAYSVCRHGEFMAGNAVLIVAAGSGQRLGGEIAEAVFAAGGTQRAAPLDRCVRRACADRCHPRRHQRGSRRSVPAIDRGLEDPASGEWWRRAAGIRAQRTRKSRGTEAGQSADPRRGAAICDWRCYRRRACCTGSPSRRNSGGAGDRYVEARQRRASSSARSSAAACGGRRLRRVFASTRSWTRIGNSGTSNSPMMRPCWKRRG